MILIEIFCIYPVLSFCSELSSVLRGRESLVDISTAGYNHYPGGFTGLFGNNVDHTIDRIGAPY